MIKLELVKERRQAITGEDSRRCVVTSKIDIFLAYLGELLLEYSQDKLLHFVFELSFVRPGISQRHNNEQSIGTHNNLLSRDTNDNECNEMIIDP
jgi:hypothetical protein